MAGGTVSCMKQKTTHNILLLVLAAALLVALSSKLVAQETAQDDVETISISTRLVRVTVTATDAKGQPTAFDGTTLKLYVDGAQQERAYLYQQEDPSHVILLVDVSGSMRGDIAKNTRFVIAEFLKASDARNRYTLFIFNRNVSKIGDFSGDEAGRRALLDALEKQKYGGDSAIYNAARQTLRDLLTAKRAHKSALVIFTDGVDNASLANTSLADDLDSFGGYSCAFVIGPPTNRDLLGSIYYPTPKSQTKEIAARLKKYIGGEAYIARGLDRDIEKVARKVAQTMRYSVELGFYPTEAAAQPGEHTVRIEGRDGMQLNLRSRLRYVIE